MRRARAHARLFASNAAAEVRAGLCGPNVGHSRSSRARGRSCVVSCRVASSVLLYSPCSHYIVASAPVSDIVAAHAVRCNLQQFVRASSAGCVFFCVFIDSQETRFKCVRVRAHIGDSAQPARGRDVGIPCNTPISDITCVEPTVLQHNAVVANIWFPPRATVCALFQMCSSSSDATTE